LGGSGGGFDVVVLMDDTLVFDDDDDGDGDGDDVMVMVN